MSYQKKSQGACTLSVPGPREKEVTSQSHRQKEGKVLCQKSTNSEYLTHYMPCSHSVVNWFESVMNRFDWIPIANILFFYVTVISNRYLTH